MATGDFSRPPLGTRVSNAAPDGATVAGGTRRARPDATTGAWNSSPSDVYPHYELTRALLRFEPPGVPTNAFILSATLELPALNLGHWPTTLFVEQGGWSGPPDAGDWDNYTRQLGSVPLDATGWYLKVPLPGLIHQPVPTAFKLVLHTAEAVEAAAQCQLAEAQFNAPTAPTVVYAYRDAALLNLLLYAGLRVAEAAALRVGDLEIDERSGKVSVRAGKGRKYRQIPLHKTVRQALVAYLEKCPRAEDGHVFQGQRGRLGARGMQLRTHVISPFHEQAGQDKVLRSQSMGRDELLVLMPLNDRLVRDLLMVKRTDTYVRQNITTTQQATTLLGDDPATFSEAEQDVLAFVRGNDRNGLRTTMKKVVDKLLARGKLEAQCDATLLAGESLERALLNSHAYANLMLQPQIDFTPSQVRGLRDFCANFFDRPPAANAAVPVRTSPTMSRSGDIRIASSTPSPMV